MPEDAFDLHIFLPHKDCILAYVVQKKKSVLTNRARILMDPFQKIVEEIGSKDTENQELKTKKSS